MGDDFRQMHRQEKKPGRRVILPRDDRAETPVPEATGEDSREPSGAGTEFGMPDGIGSRNEAGERRRARIKKRAKANGHTGDQAGEELIDDQNWNKQLKVFGWVAIGIFVASLFFLPADAGVQTGEAARNAIENQVSTSLSAGAILMTSDEMLAAQDHTITHQSDQDTTRIKVWDYAAEDGDFVQILYNGAPYTDPFMIKHKPREITVPSVGEVQIRGTRDGGGGITYAVLYELNGTIYFNSTGEGEHNTYTLIRE
jgi:hypothetical protein